MNSHRLPLILLSLLGSSALITGAAAQGTAGQLTPGQECQALTQLTTENREQLRPEWVTEAEGVVTAADPANCAAYYEQATMALQGQGNVQGTDAEAAARIVVTQPDPQVTVQQPPPEVLVTTPQPQVSVNQGQPEVLVRQAAPNVRVQIPQPIITIDMPPPEVIVRMPPPDVAVTSPEPQIEVRQSEPQVSVQQAEPQVQVQAAPQVAGQPEAQVNVEQGQAQVTQVPAEGQPQINIQQQEPTVRFEAAEPNIQVEQGGEPQIQFNQTGEATVRVEPMGEQQPAAGQQQPPAGQQQPAAGEQQNAMAGQQQNAETEGAGTENTGVVALIRVIEPIEPGQPTPVAVRDLIGQTLLNAEDTNLGTIEGVVRAGQNMYVVLSGDSPLARGDRRVVLPLNNVSRIGDQLVLRGLTDQELSELSNYDATQAQYVGEEEQVEIGAS